jgi:TonB-linked SusC/RagA family outer membrane protein
MQKSAYGAFSQPGKCGIKIVLIMKITALLLTVGCLHAGANGFSQKISLSLKNAPLVEVFQKIETQTGYGFIYAKEQVGKMKPVDLHVVNAELFTVLEMVFKNQAFSYTISSGNIIIKEKKAATVEQGSVEQAPPFTVTGRIVNEDGKPLEGVSVVLKTSKKGVSTNGEGRFSIEVPGEGNVLVFSFVGLESREIKVSAATFLDITMKAKEAEGQEVVIVGYGGVRKSDLTGSVSSVKKKDLTAYPSSNPVQALQGRAAGVLVQANNGNPGGGFKIRVRGGTSVNASSDPIFVVDGFAGALLPPAEDIESMEILKDASATAIYGSRGANGVILITTKRGKAGKTRIEINSSYSTQNEINRLDLLNADEFAGLIKEANPSYTPGTANTDWQDLIFNRGNIQNHQLSFSGGNDAVHYYISGAYFDQKGIITNSSFRRFSITSNLDFNATSWLKVGLNLFTQSNKEVGVITQEASGGATGTGVIAGAFKFGPDQPVLRPDGTYSIAVVGDPFDNPVATAVERQNEEVGDRLQYNLYADFSISKGLKFKTTFGSFINNERNGQFTPTTLNAGRNVGGAATMGSRKVKSFINENFLTYTKQFGSKHTFSGLGGVSYQKFLNESFGASSQSFLTNSVSFWNLGGGSVSLPGNSALTESTLASVYARLNYNFSDKYLLTFNGRYDGSSNFSKNYKWAFFPSAALAWNMHNEKFMGGVDFISSFKWRLSYGLTGNQAINPYQTLARFSPVFTVLNGVAVNAVRPTTIANENLKWETTAQQNIGVDIGLFKTRINVTADYYLSKTSDLLFNVQLPNYSGYTTQLKNIGKIENKGFEFAINTKNLVGKFQWNTDFNMSFNRNKVVELPGGNDIVYAFAPGHMVGISNSAQVLRVGQPVGSFYGWLYDGVYQQGATFIPGAGFEQVAGGESFRDISGKKDATGKPLNQPDGLLNGDDRTVIGNPNPDFIWGLNNDFNFHNFDLNIFFQGSQGNDLLSYTLLELETLSAINNSTKVALNRWTPGNTNTAVPKVATGRPQRVSSRWIFDGSYIRLKNLALGYALPANFMRRMKMQRVRVYISAQNILTFTDYRGYDPEVNYRNANLNAGVDYGSYPNAKSYTAGLNITF